MTVNTVHSWRAAVVSLSFLASTAVGADRCQRTLCASSSRQFLVILMMKTVLFPKLWQLQGDSKVTVYREVIQRSPIWGKWSLYLHNVPLMGTGH